MSWLPGSFFLDKRTFKSYNKRKLLKGFRFAKQGGYMIEVKHVSKEFVSPKKYPGLKGAIKGLFSSEKFFSMS